MKTYYKATRPDGTLDEMIAKLQLQLSELPPRTRLAYALVSLPRTTRRTMSKRLGLFHDGDDGMDRQAFARAVFERARSQKKLAELWRALAQEGAALPLEPPHNLEDS